LLAVTTALSMLADFSTVPVASAGIAAPPSRVGQIASLNGTVSFNGSGSGGWAAAALNYPVSSGDAIYTQDSSQAAIALDTSALTLSSDTELQVTGLDDQTFAATESQGELALAVSDLQPGQSFSITTPRGVVSITQDGQYDIIAGDANNPTTVNVFQGAATVTAPGATLPVAAGQSGVLTGTDQTVAQLGQAQQDSFTNAVFGQAAPPPPPSYAPPVVQQMTGTAELSQYGSWDQSQQYGAVWYPNVSPGWAPYREGHWADIQPWGWTWVESEPWGFAPFHYGRWVDYNDRWGWAPAPDYSEGGGYGPSYQPVYAPAVVSFFGVALAAGITIAALSSGSVGWVPLAPDEPYYPTYNCPPAYIRQINYVNVRNINVVNVTNNYYHLANRRGATYIPADVMARGERVSGYARPVTPEILSSARPIDTGFGGHGPGQPAGFRLPEATMPLAHLRPGIAPRPTSFSERHSLPPAMISHEPFNGHPQAMTMPHEMNNGMQPNHSFATLPGYHAPPPPPAEGQHLGALPQAQNFHPMAQNHYQPQQGFHPVTTSQTYHAPGETYHAPGETYHAPGETYHAPGETYHAPAQTYHPSAETYHTPEQTYHAPEQTYHPPVQTYHPSAETYHAPEQTYHAPEQTYHPPVQTYHPQEQQFHPQEQQFHPQEQFHPQAAPRPEPPHNGPDKHPG
jgi:hypothetical protein